MLERIVRLSLPTLALIVGGGLTFPSWTDGTVAAGLATVLGTSSPQVQAPPLFAVQCAGCHGGRLSPDATAFCYAHPRCR